ncbi:NO-binding membrane sensor protein with MHYT domain [Edaphobacter lichenicola]|uniref:NO-binding membrane sensor protein with MHYT domain n=1 Tax=Tunturiibacter empetritectus TaxID=3069691 RepID=A0A7W8MTW0_9BACT|nr:NO-binding membrane sensor protein with MHYT domain [Edaphobacter lichenicola]
MKSKFRSVAKLLGVLIVVVFVCPPGIFSTSFAPGILVQIAIGGILFLTAIICWHFSGMSAQEIQENLSKSTATRTKK